MRLKVSVCRAPKERGSTALRRPGFGSQSQHPPPPAQGQRPLFACLGKRQKYPKCWERWGQPIPDRVEARCGLREAESAPRCALTPPPPPAPCPLGPGLPAHPFVTVSSRCLLHVLLLPLGRSALNPESHSASPVWGHPLFQTSVQEACLQLLPRGWPYSSRRAAHLTALPGPQKTPPPVPSCTPHCVPYSHPAPSLPAPKGQSPGGAPFSGRLPPGQAGPQGRGVT